MKSATNYPLLFVLTVVVLVAISIACSASRSATSPAAASATPPLQTTETSQVIPTAQEKTICTLTIASAPVIKHLKLGMTQDEVLAVFPGSNDDAELRSQLSRPPSKFGNSNFVISPDKYKSKAEFSGISQIVFTLLDGRVSGFTVQYNGPAWPHVDQFITKFNEDAGLPPADQWEAYPGLDTQMKTLTCADFSIRLFAGGEGGNLNYVLVQDLEADKKLKERRKKAREQASPTPNQ